MFDMVRLREVRHLKYTYTVHRQFGDSISANSDMGSVSSSTAEYMSAYLFVCLSVSLSVSLIGILPLASDLYKLRHCLGLTHNFFQRRPQVKTIQIGQHKENVVVTLDHPGSSGGEHVCPVFQGL